MVRGSGGGWQRVVLPGCGLGGLVVLAVLWNKAPALYPHAADPTVAIANTRAGILTAMAGFVAFTGVMINVAETRRANDHARERDLTMLAETRRATELTHTRELAAQLADRYTAAVTQLGSDTLDVRLGGLYALERIAVDSPADHRTVVEVLSAFVREHTIPDRPGTLRRQRTRPVPAAPPADGAKLTEPAGPDTDIQAALTVLGRLPARAGVPRADLTGAVLTGAVLTGAVLTGASLFEATLTHADLGGVDLTGADLVAATLTGADLSRTTLTGADLGGATLTRADLTGAVLTGADLVAATLTRADLTGAVLTDAQLVGATLTGAVLVGATLTDTVLVGANLTDTDLSQEQLEVARGDGRTVLPAGVERPVSWSKNPPSPPSGVPRF
ncbi:pentapeptide repeat-containing protein [Frankia sp. Cas3]|uniref:pentapeptide repeat-containing protein n=1 Tax=Frankia sp. Cas3 TaxID=3073926 RepID=UPI002AD4BF9E|nr:pentapeptide repeat-containing protein [Frankia sp. Cas3]